MYIHCKTYSFFLMQKNRTKYSLVLIILLLIGGCGAYVLDSAQNDLRSSFAAGDFLKTVELLHDFQLKTP